MMIKSMTGYGKASFRNDELFLSIEMKSVNHRFLDVSIRLPNQFLQYEDSLRRAVRNRIKRGKVDLYVTIEGEKLFQKDIHVNWTLLSNYIETLNQIKRMHHLSSEISIDHLLHLTEIFTIVDKEEDFSDLHAIFEKTCEQAVDDLIAMREKEGEVLYRNILDHLANIDAFIENIRLRIPESRMLYEGRLYDKIKELLNDKMEIDESRILTEVAIFSEKANIQEEITRLESHSSQFRTVLREGGLVGRKLDFLIQEMNREINTIGSKGNDLVINNEVIELKSELEMIKEQIQNIE